MVPHTQQLGCETRWAWRQGDDGDGDPQKAAVPHPLEGQRLTGVHARQQIFEVLTQESTCAQSQDGHNRVTRTGEDNAKVGQGSTDRGRGGG